MSKLLKQMNGVEKLSADCWQLVFDHLNQDELKTGSMVCKDFLTTSNLVKQSLKVVHPEISKLSRYLKRFVRLKTMDLSNFEGDLDEAIREVARSELSLEALYCCPEAAFEIEDLIRQLSSSPTMRNLKTLTLNTFDYLRDNNLVVIANSFLDSEELEIGVCFSGLKSEFPVGHAIEYLASKLKLLNKITLFGRNVVSDQSLPALSVNCLSLKDVTINNHGGYVTENGIGLLLRNRPNLEAVSIGSIRKHSTSTITI